MLRGYTRSLAFLPSRHHELSSQHNAQGGTHLAQILVRTPIPDTRRKQIAIDDKIERHRVRKVQDFVDELREMISAPAQREHKSIRRYLVCGFSLQDHRDHSLALFHDSEGRGHTRREQIGPRKSFEIRTKLSIATWANKRDGHPAREPTERPAH